MMPHVSTGGRTDGEGIAQHGWKCMDVEQTECVCLCVEPAAGDSLQLQPAAPTIKTAEVSIRPAASPLASGAVFIWEQRECD